MVVYRPGRTTSDRCWEPLNRSHPRERGFDRPAATIPIPTPDHPVALVRFCDRRPSAVSGLETAVRKNGEFPRTVRRPVTTRDRSRFVTVTGRDPAALAGHAYVLVGRSSGDPERSHRRVRAPRSGPETARSHTFPRGRTRALAGTPPSLRRSFRHEHCSGCAPASSSSGPWDAISVSRHGSLPRFRPRPSGGIPRPRAPAHGHVGPPLVRKSHSHVYPLILPPRHADVYVPSLLTPGYYGHPRLTSP